MRNKKLELLINHDYMRQYFDSRIEKFFGSNQKLIDLKIKECRTFSDITIAVKYTLKTENHMGEKLTYEIRGSASSEDEFIQMRAKAYQLMNSIPILSKPLAFDEKLGLLLYIEIPGTTLRHFLCADSNNEEKIKFIKLSAEWLANLHSFNYILEEKQDEEFLQTKIAIFKNAFLRHWQERYSEIEKLLDSVSEERFLVYDPNLFIACHGDFTPSNIIIQRRHNFVTAIDFIDAVMADPVYDITVFLVQIEDLAVWQHLNRQAGENFKKNFIDQYQKSSPSINKKNWTKRLNIHQAFNAMQVAKFTVEAVPWIDKRNRAADKLLEYAHRCIIEKEEIVI